MPDAAAPGPPWSRLPATYDAVADSYLDRFGDELDAKPRDRQLLADLADDVALAGPVVDLGCGPGHIGAFLGRRGIAVAGLDASAAMARLASARLHGAARGDLRALPLADASVAGVVAFYSLIHLPADDLPMALAEIRRILRPGAPALLSFHEGDGLAERDEFVGLPVPVVATLHRLDHLQAALTSAGLTVELAERRPPYDNEGDTVRLYLRARRPAANSKGRDPGAGQDPAS